MEKYIVGMNEFGTAIISDSAPMANVNIGGYVAEDGVPLVTCDNTILGRLPDLVEALHGVERDFKLREAMNVIKKYA